MLKCTSAGVDRRIEIVVIEPLSSRVRHATDPGTPSAQTIADLIGETWLTTARWCWFATWAAVPAISA